MFTLKLFLLTILNSIITIDLALTLFGIKRSIQKVLLISLLTGGLDYIIMNIIVPTYNLTNGIHILIGLILLPICCRYIFNITILGSVIVTLLTYILSTVAEFLIFIMLIVFKGVEKIDLKAVVSIYGLSGYIILLIFLVYLKTKNIKLIKLPIEENTN